MGHIGRIHFSFTADDVPRIEEILRSAPEYVGRTEHTIENSEFPGYMYGSSYPDMEYFIEKYGIWVNCYLYLKETDMYIRKKLEESFGEVTVSG